MAEAAVKENPKAKQSTKPGEPAPKAKKEKIKKVPYPGLNVDPATGKATTKLDAYPADFDAKIHEGLKRVHFNNEAPLLEKRAEELEARAKKLRTEANDVRKLGNAEQRGKVKKLRGMLDRFSELQKELEADGIPTEEFKKMFEAALGAPAPESAGTAA